MLGGKIMRRSALEKATLVRGAAARKNLCRPVIPHAPGEVFRRTRQVSDGQPQIDGLA
jgi:hypothetical protein